MNYKLLAARASLLLIALFFSIAAYPTHRDPLKLIGGIIWVYVVAWIGGEISRLKAERLLSKKPLTSQSEGVVK